MEVINKSKSYILPLLDDFVEIKHVMDIYNTYLFLEGRDDRYIIIKYTKNDLVTEYISELKLNELFIEVIEDKSFYYVILAVPDKVIKDYDNFLSGKFSEISNKDKILKFLSKHYTSRHFQAIQRIKQVLYKDKALKSEMEYSLDILIPEESELSSIPNKQTETLKL